MWYRRAVLNTQCCNVWTTFVAIKMGGVDGPHLRLLRTLVKSLFYPVWISVYSSESGGRELEGVKKGGGEDN